MSSSTQAPKHLVRAYLARRQRTSTPPPTPEEIRRQLGWELTMPAKSPSGRG